MERKDDAFSIFKDSFQEDESERAVLRLGDVQELPDDASHAAFMMHFGVNTLSKFSPHDEDDQEAYIKMRTEVRSMCVKLSQEENNPSKTPILNGSSNIHNQQEDPENPKVSWKDFINFPQNSEVKDTNNENSNNSCDSNLWSCLFEYSSPTLKNINQSSPATVLKVPSQPVARLLPHANIDTNISSQPGRVNDALNILNSMPQPPAKQENKEIHQTGKKLPQGNSSVVTEQMAMSLSGAFHSHLHKNDEPNGVRKAKTSRAVSSSKPNRPISRSTAVTSARQLYTNDQNSSNQAKPLNMNGLTALTERNVVYSLPTQYDPGNAIILNGQMASFYGYNSVNGQPVFQTGSNEQNQIKLTNDNINALVQTLPGSAAYPDMKQALKVAVNYQRNNFQQNSIQHTENMRLGMIDNGCDNRIKYVSDAAQMVNRNNPTPHSTVSVSTALAFQPRVVIQNTQANYGNLNRETASQSRLVNQYPTSVYSNVYATNPLLAQQNIDPNRQYNAINNLNNQNQYQGINIQDGMGLERVLASQLANINGIMLPPNSYIQNGNQVMASNIVNRMPTNINVPTPQQVDNRALYVTNLQCNGDALNSQLVDFNRNQQISVPTIIYNTQQQRATNTMQNIPNNGVSLLPVNYQNVGDTSNYLVVRDTQSNAQVYAINNPYISGGILMQNTNLGMNTYAANVRPNMTTVNYPQMILSKDQTTQLARNMNFNPNGPLIIRGNNPQF